ncbi:MAG: PD-(D/E)XK nuclease family transposase [Rhodoferax sp.]|nr:PD-(D/E)XK nuclease family transposase [Rhodoferax sp.]
MRLLDPKNDYVFKRLFAVAPHLLTALINAVRSEDEPLEVIEVLNPRIDPEDLVGKFIVLDILTKDRHGRRINVEMRSNALPLERPQHLLPGQRSDQTDRQRRGYAEFKPVIGIHLLDFDLFDEPHQLNQAHWCFEMRDRWQPTTKLGSELELNIIELGKADRLHSTCAQSCCLGGFLNTGARVRHESVVLSPGATSTEHAQRPQRRCRNPGPCAGARTRTAR